MEIIYKTGNLLDAQTDIIAHQVNCQGVMGSGVAKQIKEKWPEVFDEYKKLCNGVVNDGDYHIEVPKDLLGVCQIVFIKDNNTKIANLFAQDNYGKNKRYTNYEYLYLSLENLKKFDPKNIAFPYKMSSDRGGADWDVVLAMIKSVFKDTNITIEIWKL